MGSGPNLSLPLTICITLGFGLGACSTTRPAPIPIEAPVVPLNLRSPQPKSLESADLRAIFKSTDAPDSEKLKDCDADFKTLKERVEANDEFVQGVKELIASDPIKYHWCFYSKLLSLNEALQESKDIHDRQSTVIRVYLFLAPVARAFYSEFSDSRYLRRAIFKYRTLSETVFYHKVEAYSNSGVPIAGVFNRQPANTAPTNPGVTPPTVLSKYGLIAPTEPAAGDVLPLPDLFQELARDPAALAAPEPIVTEPVFAEPAIEPLVK